MYFVKSKGCEIRNAHPDMGLGSIAKELGSQWGKLSIEDRNVYDAQKDKDRERYNAQMIIYKEIDQDTFDIMNQELKGKYTFPMSIDNRIKIKMEYYNKILNNFFIGYDVIEPAPIHEYPQWEYTCQCYDNKIVTTGVYIYKEPIPEKIISIGVYIPKVLLNLMTEYL
jgi:hypothetical protein